MIIVELTWSFASLSALIVARLSRLAWKRNQTVSERSIASANRPERRAVLDRERTKAVAEKQAEAIEATKALAARKRREVMEVGKRLVRRRNKKWHKRKKKTQKIVETQET